MRNLKWVSLSLIALGLLAVAIYVGTKPGPELSQSYKIPIRPDEIQSMTLQKDGKLYFEFQKKDLWKIESHFQDEYSVGADQNYIDKFIQKTIETRLTSVASYENLEKLKEFGLFNPKFVLSLKKKDGLSYTLYLSEKTNYEGKHFYRNDKDKQIYISDVDLFNDLNQKPIYFLNKRISHPDWSMVDKVYIEGLNEKFYLVKNKEKWSVFDSSFQLDQDLVKILFSKFSDVTIQDYIGSDSARLFWNSNNQKQSLQMHFFSGNSTWSFDLSMDEDNRRLMAKENGKNYILDPTLWQFFANLNRQFFYDKKSYFVFDKSKAKKIQLSCSGRQMIVEGSQPQYDALLEELHNLEADGVISEKVDFTQGCRIQVLNVEGISILNIQVLVKNKNEGVYLASDKTKSAFILSKEKYNKLNIEELQKGLK